MFMKDGFSNRINYIDFLKFIGLTCIILAHVNPPEWIFMIRNFDVPLMVIISAILGQKTFKKYKGTALQSASFCVKRAKRLIYPTWIFLFAYFVLLFFVGEVYNYKYYMLSFLLTRYGVGYVWIVLIYLYSALMIPLCDKLSKCKQPLLGIIVIYFVYELMCCFEIGMKIKLIDSTVYYIIPYGMLTYLGFNYQRFSKKIKMIIVIVAAVAFTVIGIYYWIQYGEFQNVQIAKYPSRAYYLSYGILISFVLLCISEKVNLKLYTNKIVVFISSHSMWIYLWHIMALYLYSYLNLVEIWYIKLIVVYSVSMIAVIITNKLLDIIDKRDKCLFFQYLRY